MGASSVRIGIEKIILEYYFLHGMIRMAKCVCTGSVFLLLLAACSTGAKEPQQWESPPAMMIDEGRFYLATLKTDKGEILIELFAEKTPTTVNNFVFLAEQGYYDQTTFHRVIEGFMAQGGDPTGTGAGGPGYIFKDEFHPDLRFTEAGLLAMANSGPNTNGSQFFITYGPTLHLNGRHTIFGKVLSGMDVARSLTPRDPQDNPEYDGDRLLSVEIEVVDRSMLPPPTLTPIPIVPQLTPGRPLAELEISERENLFTGRPDMTIAPGRSYSAIVQTTKGAFTIEMHPQDAPESVNNFVVLAELGYWDGFPIVHVERDSLFVTGSPAGRLDSDIGYTLPPETSLSHTPGAVGFIYRQDLLAISGSQFYVAYANLPQLDGQFSVFGYVIEGLDVARQLTLEDRIESIIINSQ